MDHQAEHVHFVEPGTTNSIQHHHSTFDFDYTHTNTLSRVDTPGISHHDHGSLRNNPLQQHPPRSLRPTGRNGKIQILHQIVYRLLEMWIQYPVLGGLVIRLLVAWILPALLDNGTLVPGFSYTDIDYEVFTDAAHAMRVGMSPYVARHTYRYTPFLALILSKLPLDTYPQSGRILFCLADVACGGFIRYYRQQSRRPQDHHHHHHHHHHHQEPVEPIQKKTLSLSTLLSSDACIDALWWLYNPLAINICTRGSAEALVLLPVLLTVGVITIIPPYQHSSQSQSSQSSIAISSPPSSSRRVWVTITAGITHGIAVHAKLYPIIYTISFAAYLSSPLPLPLQRSSSSSPVSMLFFLQPRIIVYWMKRLMAPIPLLFVISFACSWTSLTYLAYRWYGPASLNEGLLYHVLKRVDHRHNYSPAWYGIYLARGVAASTATASTSGAAGLQNRAGVFIMALSDYMQRGGGGFVVGFLPQAYVLLGTSLGVAPHQLPLAMFVQTFVFVALNKVITAQYFTWYAVLWPLCSSVRQNHHFASTSLSSSSLFRALAIFFASMGLWLGSAYCLEMLGWACHRANWMASLFFLAANVHLFLALVSSLSLSSTTTGGGTTKITRISADRYSNKKIQ